MKNPCSTRRSRNRRLRNGRHSSTRLAATDVALRRRLELLLAGHDKTIGILDQPVGPLPSLEASTQSPVGDVAGTECAGTVVAGRYVLLEEVGEGGMGTVWMAEQTQPVRRMVALKLIRAGMDSRTVLSRFEAERQALALMDHPNIAKVLDGGTTEQRPALLRHGVRQGRAHHPVLRRRPPEHRRAPRAVCAGCQAVQHAHPRASFTAT